MLGIEIEHRQFPIGHGRGVVGECPCRRVNVLELDIRRCQMAQAALEAIPAEHELVADKLDSFEALKRAHAVVAARHRLDEQIPDRRFRRAHRARQASRQRPGTLDDLLDPAVCVCSRRVVGKRDDVLLHLGVHPLASRRDHGLVEVPKADLPGQVRDHRVASIERHHQAVERFAEVVTHVAGELLGVLEPAVEDCQDRSLRRLRALLGEEQAVARLLERGGAIQRNDPVVSERAAQLLDERRGQALGLRIE